LPVALFVLSSASPFLRAGDECGTRILPEQVPDMLELQSKGMYEPGPRERYVLSVPLTVHIVRRSNGTGGIAQGNIDSSLADANSRWLPTGTQFLQSGATRFIDSDSFYNSTNTQAKIDQLRNTDTIANTINTYFVPNLADSTGTLCGQGTFTTTAASQGVVIDNSCTHDSGNTSTFAHELGHFFDLYHTHESSFGLECPDESNCGTAGDLLCDTAADPDLTGNLQACTYNGTATRCGGETFSPDPANLMSYGGACRLYFTNGQCTRALGTLVNLRSNLINPPGLNVTWVQFNSFGTHNGSFDQPFDSISAARDAVAPGGRIVIKASSANQPVTISTAMTLDSFRGIAHIGP